MFSGIIEDLGKVKTLNRSSQSGMIGVETGIGLDQVKIGDSIAVNGACLTVTSINSKFFEADISPETFDKTVLGQLNIGDRVNLERALRLSDRINGHLVSGHIDGVGVISEKKDRGNAIVVTIKIPEKISNYIIEKGSVAVDGISLTVNDCPKGFISLSVIPLTAQMTTIGFKAAGAHVNIEIDMIAKYVERMLQNPQSAEQRGDLSKQATSITKEMLANNGFL